MKNMSYTKDVTFYLNLSLIPKMNTINQSIQKFKFTKKVRHKLDKN
jgi:hypothetical protein